MKNFIIALSVSWYGLFVGVENTSFWKTPFKQPGISTTIVGMFGVGKVTLRGAYIQPLQPNGFGPSIQFGASVRIF